MRLVEALCLHRRLVKLLGGLIKLAAHTKNRKEDNGCNHHFCCPFCLLALTENHYAMPFAPSQRLQWRTTWQISRPHPVTAPVAAFRTNPILNAWILF